MIEQLKGILLSSRMKSLYWRTGMMLLSVLIGQSLEVVNIFLTGPELVIAGLILGECSKAVNNALSEDN